MNYRTKTYIAADWDADIGAVNQLYKWNDSKYYKKIDFVDVHEFVQARDSSLYCTIKNSLNIRMNMSKTFILIVGNHTNSITKGGCQYCDKYKILNNRKICSSGHIINYKSYVEYESDLAVKNNLNIVVLYNSNIVNKLLCPVILRNIGVHVPMIVNGAYSYMNVKNAILKAES